MTRTLFIPAETLNAARRIAYAVDVGRLPMLPHYASEEAAAARAALLGETHACAIPVFPIILEHRATHDGRIPVARLVDAAGSLAAALALVIGGAWAVGLGSVL